MFSNKVQSEIQHILCPTDLTPRSQKALGFAARMAETFNAQLTACHCAPASWFSSVNRLPEEETAKINAAMNGQIVKCQEVDSTVRRRTLVIENSFEPARDILNAINEADVDLVVMKARPGVLSALHFGSIVERVVSGADCPVLLFPSNYLAGREPGNDELKFRRILFDYDFSFATDRLLKTVNAMTQGYRAELHLLSVLEPPLSRRIEPAAAGSSSTVLQAAVREKLSGAIRNNGSAPGSVRPAVEWGDRAETVLRYARDNSIDLICTTLAQPNLYVEKLYRAYLGDLLKSSNCPILVKQSV